jgi:ABC-2 type transport system ATP-binding protein
MPDGCTTIRKMAAIEVRELCRTYKVFRKREGVWASVRGLFHREHDIVSAVRNVSFTIEEGEMVAFLGPNGAGKTTTLKLLSGLVVPTSGTAHVLGHIPWKREDAYRRRFSLVTGQKEQLWWDLPAQESFRLHKEIYRISTDDYRRRLDELTDLLEVGRLMSQPVRELSLGERMRMELIAALLHRPDVSVSGRTDDRSGRRQPAACAGIPPPVPARTANYCNPDQSLYERCRSVM